MIIAEELMKKATRAANLYHAKQDEGELVTLIDYYKTLVMKGHNVEYMGINGIKALKYVIGSGVIKSGSLSDICPKAKKRERWMLNELEKRLIP